MKQHILRCLAAVMLLGSSLVWAFDEQQLAEQLTATRVLRGDFVQEKHLRGLQQPLRSTGQFVLARGQGLLWNLKKPLQRNYRISFQGVDLFRDGQWQVQGNQDAAARQSRLFLAVLQGDQQGLREEFDLQLEGTEQDWLLTLKPKSLLLKQIFQRIEVHGDRYVRSIEIFETQGDRTLMQMLEVQQDQELQADEQAAFAP